jgi:hypothetical protein
MKDVLFIENDPVLSQKIKDHFSGASYKRSIRFKHGSTLEEAYFILSNERFDIIFLDLGMDHAEDDMLVKYGGKEIVTQTEHCTGLELMIMLQVVRPDVAKAHKVVVTGNPNFESVEKYYKKVLGTIDWYVKEADYADIIGYMSQIIKQKKN